MVHLMYLISFNLSFKRDARSATQAGGNPSQPDKLSHLGLMLQMYYTQVSLFMDYMLCESFAGFLPWTSFFLVFSLTSVND